MNCPTCHDDLIEAGGPDAGEGAVRWVCARCGGALEPFDALVDGSIRTTSTATGIDCPKCGTTMHKATADTEPAGGTDVAACDGCRLVWLDASDRSMVLIRLPPDVVPGDVEVFVPPATCPNCGAPWQVVGRNTCKWCGATLLMGR